MKKLISILLTVCIALSAMSVGFVFASAEGTQIKGTDVTWSYDPETHVLFFDGEGAIPDYNDYESTDGVVNVKYPWKGLEYTSIVFGADITGIGNYAFCYSTALDSVTLPSNISVLGKGIFLNCKELKTVVIKAKSGSVSENMFAGCDKLTTVELMSGIKSVAKRAFYNCSALESITIPEGVTSIGEDAFYQCTSLLTADIADSVKTIGAHAFYSCEKLNSLQLGKGLETIGSNAFDNCRSLKSVVIPEKVSLISSAAFSGCQQLETVVLPENLKEIQTKAFNYCYVLKSIEISAKTEKIGATAFGFGKYNYVIEGFTVKGYDGSAAEKYAKDNGLKFVSLGDYYSGKIGENIEWSFDKATGTLSITGSGAVDGFDADRLPAYAKRFAGEVKAIDIDEKITAIGDYAFAGVTPAGVTIPAAVESIGEKAFGDAKPVISSYNNSAAQKYAVDNGLEFIDLDPAPAEFPEIKLGETYPALTDENTDQILFYSAEISTTDFINALNKDDFTAVIASTETVSTGTVITFEAIGEKKEYTVVIPGDINGDGRVNSSDALAILQHSVGSKLLEGVNLVAAEMTNDDSINSADALAVLQIAVGRYQITDFMKKAENTPPAEDASLPSDADKIA